MKTVTFTVVKNSTGEERNCVSDVEDDYTPENTYFLFGDGNYGCDCNRHIFFAGDRDEDDEHPCGETEYSIKNLKLDGVDVMEYMKREYGDNVEPI